MRRLEGTGRGPLGRPQVHRLGPVGGALALLAAIPLMLVALFALAAAMVFARGKGGVRVWRFGGPMPAKPGGAGGDADEGATGAAPGAGKPREKSHAEVVEALPLVLGLSAALLAGALVPGAAFAKMLVPMDDAQTNHLKAYGLAFWVLEQGQKVEWLLNYRGGSFLFADDPATEREANIRGVTLEPVNGSAEAAIRAKIADENMESVALEKAPKVAVYIPPNTPPWDDAVTLALQYAEIPYARVWDEEVLTGDLAKYDWLHLHHEDFTGQYGKFWAAYHSMPWYSRRRLCRRRWPPSWASPRCRSSRARSRSRSATTSAAAASCSRCARRPTPTTSPWLPPAWTSPTSSTTATRPTPRRSRSSTSRRRSRSATSRSSPTRSSTSSRTSTSPPRRTSAGRTRSSRCSSSAPRTTRSRRCSRRTTSTPCPSSSARPPGFRRSKLKPGVIVLGEVEGTDEVKYLHGNYGRGTFTFLGGHDPEDYQHMVGDPETKLDQYPHSPGYRLILNNVLFPAAEKKKQKT